MNDHSCNANDVFAAPRQSPGCGPIQLASSLSNASDGSSASTLVIQSTAAASPSTLSLGHNKRNNGILSFLRWFRLSPKNTVSSPRASPASTVSSSRLGGSNSSLNSTGTAASFSFVPPEAYAPKISDKSIQPAPETDTYKARLKQRDKSRENDKNTTLRKKYNLFFNSAKGGVKGKDPTTNQAKRLKHAEDNSKSLPLMTKTKIGEQDRGHRRANSDSSKESNAGGFLHVKGKRKAPLPPKNQSQEENLLIRRQKRLAPLPPEKLLNADNLEPADRDMKCNINEHEEATCCLDGKDLNQKDSVEFDNGIPKSHASCAAGETGNPIKNGIQVSPKPWYKLTSNSKGKPQRMSKYEPIDNSNKDHLKLMKTDDKRKSDIMFLTNISELDREANEIIKNKANGVNELPKMVVAPPKRKSTMDLIAKFNAITGVTKASSNSAFSSASKQSAERNGRGAKYNELTPKPNTECQPPLIKSETTTCFMSTPQNNNHVYKSRKNEKKKWICTKCALANDYWRIICLACSTIKPYFDNFTPTRSLIERQLPSSSSSNNSLHMLDTCELTRKEQNDQLSMCNVDRPAALLRSKTQSSIIIKRDLKTHVKVSPGIQSDVSREREEKEELKRILIEMKNSLPKRKRNIALQNRKSTILEGVETGDCEVKQSNETLKKIPVENQITLHENILEKIQEFPTKSHNPVGDLMTTETDAATNQVLKTNKYEDKIGNKIMRNMYENLPEAKSPEELCLNKPRMENHDFGTDTLEINKLLKCLESAIAKGSINDAAVYAKDLAQLKINCSVIRQKQQHPSNVVQNSLPFTIDMFVEDRLSHRGPFHIEVHAGQTVLELKQQILKQFDIPAAVQRLIIGNQLAANDNTTLEEYNVMEGCSIFLYLIASGSSEQKEGNVNNIGELKGFSMKQHFVVDQVPTMLELDHTKNIYVPHADEKMHVRYDSKMQVPNLPAIESETLVKSTKENKSTKQKSLSNSKVEQYTDASSPRIIGEHLKVHVMIKPKTSVESQVREMTKSSLITKLPLIINQQRPETQVGSTIAITKQLKDNQTPPKAEEEDFSEYDKTISSKHTNRQITNSNSALLKMTNWTCPLCTLLNNTTTNICSACANMRPKFNNDGPSSSRLHYYELMNLDKSDIVLNSDQFECLVCFNQIPPHKGVTLRECLHQFCKECLAQTIEFCEDVEVRCPYRDARFSCESVLQDREIKALVTRQQYEQFLAKSVAQAENKMDKTYHCKTPDCLGWCVYEDNVNEFFCPICKKNNCLTCQAIHLGFNCRQYQEHMKSQSKTSENGRQTSEWLVEMVEKGEALACPVCHIVMIKKWGCDWVRCSMCKTEICWVTRGLRWGPGGKGDTSGGCKCGVNGVKCHSKCNYCH